MIDPPLRDRKQKSFTAKPDRLLIAKLKGSEVKVTSKVVGMVGVRFHAARNFVELFRVRVDLSMTRMGIGRAMLEYTIQYAREINAKVIE